MLKLSYVFFFFLAAFNSQVHARIWEDSVVPEELGIGGEDYQKVYIFWRDWHENLKFINHWITLSEAPLMDFPIFYSLGNSQYQFDPDFVFSFDGSREHAERTSLRWIGLLVATESLQKLINTKQITPELRQISVKLGQRVLERDDLLDDSFIYAQLKDSDIAEYKKHIADEISINEEELAEIKQKTRSLNEQSNLLIRDRNKMIVDNERYYTHKREAYDKEYEKYLRTVYTSALKQKWALEYLALLQRKLNEIQLWQKLRTDSFDIKITAFQNSLSLYSRKTETLKNETLNLKNIHKSVDETINKRRIDLQKKYTQWGHEGLFYQMYMPDRMLFEKMKIIDHKFSWPNDKDSSFNYWREWKIRGAELSKQLSSFTTLRKKIEAKLKVSIVDVPEALLKPENKAFADEINIEYKNFQKAFRSFQYINTEGINEFFYKMTFEDFLEILDNKKFYGN